MKFSWIPEDLIDPQGMRWHPFGIKSRRDDGTSTMAPWEITLYSRHHYLHLVNILHPSFWRSVRKHGWGHMKFWLRHLVSCGRG